MSQLELLSSQPELQLLPSAKLNKSDFTGVHAWTRFYAAFSEKFVTSSLLALNCSTETRVLDPFLGSGTTLVACLKLGIPAIGLDLDPFACLLARSKIAINADPAIVKRLLRASTRKSHLKSFSKEAEQLFDQNCLCYASTVFTRVQKRISCKKGKLLETLLDDASGIYDSEVVAITALTIGGSESAKLVRGSNPTWYKKAIPGEKDNIEALLSSTQQSASQLLKDLEELRPHAKQRNIRVINSNVSNLSTLIDDNSIDAVITSPPYLTRLDYVIKHLPNLLLLSAIVQFDIQQLRKTMIGTSKIIDKSPYKKEWGETCLTTLSAIENHGSYASKSYYVWTYSQYFSSIYNVIYELRKKLAINGKGLIVVQNSTYKDISIPLSQILEEMLSSQGLPAKIVKRDKVKKNMKYLNPKTNSEKENILPSEDVLFFNNV